MPLKRAPVEQSSADRIQCPRRKRRRVDHDHVEFGALKRICKAGQLFQREDVKTALVVLKPLVRPSGIKLSSLWKGSPHERRRADFNDFRFRAQAQMLTVGGIAHET